MSTARQTFALVSDKTITVDLLTPHRVARICWVYPTVQTFTLTVDHKPVGNSNTARELTKVVSDETTLVWTPDNLWVRNGDELIFGNTNTTSVEVTIEYVADDVV